MYFTLPEKFSKIKKIKEVNLLSFFKTLIGKEVNFLNNDDSRKSYENLGLINFSDKTHPYHVNKHHWEYFLFLLPDGFDFSDYEDDDSALKTLFRIPSVDGKFVNGYRRDQFSQLVEGLCYLGICLASDNQALYNNPDDAIFYFPLTDLIDNNKEMESLYQKIGLKEVADQPYSASLKDEIINALKRKNIAHEYSEAKKEIRFGIPSGELLLNRFFYSLSTVNDDVFPVLVVKEDGFIATTEGYEEITTNIYNESSKRLESVIGIDLERSEHNVVITFKEAEEGIGESRSLSEESTSDYVTPIEGSNFAEYLNSEINKENPTS